MDIPRVAGSSPSASTAASVNRANPADPGVRRDGALEQPVREDDVGPRELVPAGDPAVDVRAVVHEHLEVQAGRQPTGRAVAAGGRVDAPQPPPEREVAGLDRVHQERAGCPPILDEQEPGIPLELGQAERGVEATHDRLEQVAGDHGSVLELAPGQVGGVAGQVGDDEEPGLWCGGHGRDATPWTYSNVNTRRAFTWSAAPTGASRDLGAYCPDDASIRPADASW